MPFSGGLMVIFFLSYLCLCDPVLDEADHSDLSGERDGLAPELILQTDQSPLDVGIVLVGFQGPCGEEAMEWQKSEVALVFFWRADSS